MNNFPPTEVFLRLPDRSKNDRRLKQSVRRSQFLVTEVTAARLTTHRRVFEPGATKYFATGVTEIQVTADRCLFATGLSEAYVTADRSFVPNATKSLCEWRGRSTSVRRTNFICDLARTKQKWPPTEAKCPPIAISCDWGDRSTINYPPKSFRAWRENIFLRLAWPKNCFPPTEEFLRLPDRSKNDRRLKQSVRRPYILATEVTAAQLTTHRRVFAPGATDYLATGVTEEYFSADRNFVAITRPKKIDRRPKQTVRRPQFLATELTAARLTTHPDFSRGRKFLRLAWRKHKFPQT